MLQKQSIHTFFVTKTIYTPFLSQKEFTHTFFVAKTIYALRPESFCALKVAIRKVQTFWASGFGGGAGGLGKVGPMADTGCPKKSVT